MDNLTLKFRENEVTFAVKEIKGGKDKVSKSYRSDIDVNIYGADTESVFYETHKKRYEPQCSTISDPNGNDHIIWHVPNAKALNDLLEFFLINYADTEMKNGNKKCLFYYHNLSYDWLQLIKEIKDLLTMTKTGIYKANKFREKDSVNHEEDKDYFLGKFQEYFIFLRDRALFVGSAPHFTLRVMKTKNKFFDITFLDSFSFFKGSLEAVAKELKLNVQKMERQEDLGKVDYRLIPDNNKRKKEFVKYALLDSRITQNAGESIRQLHKEAGMSKFRVSSPSFAIQFLYKQLEDDNSIINGVNHEGIMQLILDTYRGGRTGGIAHGKINNISVLDFASSYPTAMLSIPSFSKTMKYVKITDEMIGDTKGILEEIKNNPNCFIRFDGRETDKKYPSIIDHNKSTKKLTPIYGEFKNIATTGYELLCGYNSGTLSIHQFKEVVFLVDTKSDVQFPFRDFAKTAYEGKQNSEKGSILYVMWKLVLNGAYGKLIESRKKVIVSVEHEEDLIPYLEGQKQEFSIMFYDEYIRAMRDGKNWNDVYIALYDEILANIPYEELKFMAFSDIELGGKEFGSYAVPGAASLITGIARARLRALMKCTDALYWDTDSVFIPDLDLKKLPSQLKKGTKWLSDNVVPLQLGEELGDIDIEMLHGTGYLAGTKRYYIHKDTGEFDPDTGEKIIKIKKAIHGLPSLPKEEIERMITYLATNQGVGSYKAKAKPLKAKESPNADLIGAFIQKENKINSLYKKDDRLTWEYDTKKDIYIGVVREWKSLI